MADHLVSPVQLRAWRNDIFSGLIASVLTISFGLSYSVLIFSGPLASLLPYGIAATFISNPSATAHITSLMTTGQLKIIGG